MRVAFIASSMQLLFQRARVTDDSLHGENIVLMCYHLLTVLSRSTGPCLSGCLSRKWAAIQVSTCMKSTCRLIPSKDDVLWL